MWYPPNAETIKAVMRGKDYLVFGGGPHPYDLNIFGIRTSNMQANTFNDWLGVMYLYGGIWNSFVFPATTDPGTYYRENPMNVAGTALLKPGQYRGSHKLGKHSGYDALQQHRDLVVYRDANRNEVLEINESETQSGWFGLDIHRSYASRPGDDVGKWSAGCQVFQDPLHFAFLMSLAKRSASFFGNSFTYTLLTEEDFE